MALRLDDLEQHLSRELAPIYVLSSDEPLQLGEACDRIRAAARQAGCTERLVFDTSRGFDWNTLLNDASSMSLFAERRILEVRMATPRPGKTGGAVLSEFASHRSDDVAIFTMPAIDGQIRRSAWYRALSQAGVAIEIGMVGPDRLPGWIAGRFRAAGVSATAQACELLAERSEGNMVAAAQVASLLGLLAAGRDADIDADDVLGASGDSARYDSFGLVDAALAGDRVRVVRMVRGLAAEGAPLPPLVGSLAWMLRGVGGAAERMARGEPLNSVFSDGSMAVWRARRTLVQRALERHPAGRWRGFIATAHRIDKASKGMSGEAPWALLERLCLEISGDAVLAD